MNLRAFSGILAVAAAAAVLVGCGGSDATITPQTTGGTQSNLSQQQILSIFNSGLDRGGSMVSSGNRSRAPKTRDHNEDHFFSDHLGLWVEMVFGNADDYTSPSGEKYTTDAEGLIEAGYDYMYVSDPSIYPLIMRNERKITAGNFAGEEETLVITWNEDESASLTCHAVYPGEGIFDYSAEYDAAGFGTWGGTFTFPNGQWEKYKFVRAAQGTTFTLETSAGVTFTLNYNEDGSGTGTITGNGDNLPATLEWNTGGIGTITWKDGTKSEVQVDVLF